MKKLFALLLVPVIAIGILCNTGCKTTSTVGPDGSTNTVTSVDPALVAPLLQTATFVGLDVLVKKDPTNAVPYIQLAVAALDTVIGGTNYSPAALTAAINALPPSALNSASVQIVVTAITQTYATYYAFYVQDQVNSSATALIFLKAVRNGAVQALATAPLNRAYVRSHRR